MQGVNIKTKLIFFYNSQYIFFRLLSMVSMHLAFKGDRQRANLPDLLIKLMELGSNKPIAVNYAPPTKKHIKTTLLYFSEQEHKAFTKYLNKALPKGLDAKQKKIAATRLILKLLSDFVLAKGGKQLLLKIYKKVQDASIEQNKGK